MTLDELKQACRDAIAREEKYGHRPGINLASKNRKSPLPIKGFPRGELLCHNSSGGSVWLYDATRLLAALEKNQCGS